MRNDKENVIVDKSIDFALALINYCELLEQEIKYVIAKQLLRSGSSIGANIFEAQNEENKVDFVHKMKIAAKEVSETQYWLILCDRDKSYKFDIKLRVQLEEINRILSKIISSSKQGFTGFLSTIFLALSNFQIITLSN